MAHGVGGTVALVLRVLFVCLMSVACGGGVASRQPPRGKALQQRGERPVSPGTQQRLEAVAVGAQAPGGQAQLATADLVKQVAESVVIVRVEDGMGAGFVISENLVVTSFHVVRGTTSIEIETAQGHKHTVLTVHRWEVESDIAVLQVLPSLSEQPVPLASGTAVDIGEPVVAIGHPLGFEATVSTGVVSSIRHAGRLKLLQVSAPISPGSSGGPVFNGRGEVIGVVRGYFDGGQSVNFATLSSDVWRLLRTPKQPQAPADFARMTSVEGFTREDNSEIPVEDLQWTHVDDVVKDCDAGDKDACYFLARGGRLPSGQVIPRPTTSSARGYLRRSCDLDESGGLCVAIAVRDYLDEDLSLRDGGADSRRDAAYLLRRGCDRLVIESAETHGLICGLADALESELVGDITGRFPHGVAGLQFGMTPQQARARCERWEPIRGSGMMACSPTPVDPFHSTVGVLVQFCGGRACEFLLVFQGDPDEPNYSAPIARRALERLTRKYGAPKEYAPGGFCRTGTGNAAQVRRTWLSRPGAGRADGMISFRYECSEGARYPTLTVDYRNRQGIDLLLQQADTQSQNY